LELGWLEHLQQLPWQRWDIMLKLFAFRIALEERTQLLLKAELTQLKTIKMMVIVFTGYFMILLKVVTIVQEKPMFTG
jgi:nicotinic acid mononucleotide adenylyltransferase